MRKRSEDDIEREQIEWVFGLTGGELEAEPWEYEEFKEESEYRPAERPAFRYVKRPHSSSFRYWYQDPPDYVDRRELASRDDYNAVFRTAVVNELYGPAPAALRDAEGIWQKVRSFRNSGETECPNREPQEDDDPADLIPSDTDPRWARPVRRVTVDEASRSESGDECPYCAERIGTAHRYIYLGDGWGEVVYRLRPPVLRVGE